MALSMDDRDGKIWMDGTMVEWRDAKIHVLTHTLHYGCGAFEGVRAYNAQGGTAIFRLREHTERLFNSAKILRMKIPFSMEEVMEAQLAVVRENKLESCYLRPLTWIGSEKLGVSPKGNTVHLMVAAWPWGAYLGEEGLKRGIRVKISSYTRHHVNITMTQAKAVSNYTNSILANMEAVDDGYDEAMLLDANGFVSEGAGENLFVVKNGVVYTPDLSAGALNGITRNTVFAICADLGLKVVEKRITRDEVYICDEAFFTGTAAEVTPIRELDRIELGSRLARADHREDPERVLRHRQRPQSEVRRMAEQGLTMTTPVATIEVTGAADLEGPGVVFCPNPKMRCGARTRASSSTWSPPAKASARTAARCTAEGRREALITRTRIDDPDRRREHRPPGSSGWGGRDDRDDALVDHRAAVDRRRGDVRAAARAARAARRAARRSPRCRGSRRSTARCRRWPR